ncbi:MAG: anhydro-N-acetylmuramic acid kinase [Elusimicrobia bacterium]|nr:anhydro-N-acetylmuramic acid kinase [Elusimicrobiota bacterium]
MKPRILRSVGLMSGTSADGVTAVLVETGAGIKVLSCRTFPYPPKVRRAVLDAARLRAPELSRLNMELGGLFADAALAVMARGKVDVIGSHGQTVWHGPEASPANTLQIGEPAVIAERTGATVVADFRPGDMAGGGQGAPLVPAFDAFLYGQGPMKALQNIGGIGNVSVAGKGRLWTAFDTGPGNCLMDLAASSGTGGRLAMDVGGRLAAQGRADERKVAILLKAPFFLKPPPKSLDRGSFGAPYLARHFGRLTRKNLPDVLATLTLLTARSIADSYQRFVLPGRGIREALVAGGGSRNPVLMALLRRELSPLPVKVSDLSGIPAMAKEAACFAWMAARAVQGLPNNCPAATGAAGPRILGKIVSGRKAF